MDFKQFLIENIIDQLGAQYHRTPSKVEVKPKAYAKGKAKSCFDNSYHYVKDHPSSKYVLGYMMFKGQIPIEHAWVKEGSSYFEVTPTKQNEDDVYYSLWEFDLDELLDIIAKSSEAPNLYHAMKYTK